MSCGIEKSRRTPADRWAHSRFHRLLRDPTRPAGADVASWQVPGDRPGARWAGWELRVVGLWWPDLSPAIVFTPEERGWPVASLVTNYGQALTVQWWFLRVAPPTEVMWLEAQWRPGWTEQRLLPSPFRYADDQALADYPTLISDAVAFLQAKAPRRPPLNPTDVKAELYSAWDVLVSGGTREPTNEDVSRQIGKSIEDLHFRVALLRRAGFRWPPGTSRGTTGR
jgi:hypothetical protein